MDEIDLSFIQKLIDHAVGVQQLAVDDLPVLFEECFQNDIGYFLRLVHGVLFDGYLDELRAGETVVSLENLHLEVSLDGTGRNVHARGFQDMGDLAGEEVAFENSDVDIHGIGRLGNKGEVQDFVEELPPGQVRYGDGVGDGEGPGELEGDRKGQDDGKGQKNGENLLFSIFNAINKESEFIIVFHGGPPCSSWGKGLSFNLQEWLRCRFVRYPIPGIRE